MILQLITKYIINKIPIGQGVGILPLSVSVLCVNVEFVIAGAGILSCWYHMIARLPSMTKPSIT